MTSALWTLREMRSIGARIAPAGVTDTWIASGVSIDSRTLRPGDLFVAIRGLARDGHEFVDAALDRGAAGALVAADAGIAERAGRALFVVDDTLKALERLGLASRDRAKSKRIGVTGSVGKTSTKEALKLCLSVCGPTHASEASYNNLWGVPLTLARMPAETQFGVFEIGMNHAGEITPLTALVRPHAAIVTTVEAVHLENFDSVEEIAEAKAEIFKGLVPGGTAIINLDNPHFARLKQRAEECGAGHIISFGEDPRAEARLEAIELSPTGSKVTALIAGERVRFSLGAPGRHNAINALAVLSGVAVLGADIGAAAEALSGLRAPAGRGSRLVIPWGEGQITLLDESYNANPASMRAAIGNLSLIAPARGGRRIAVLGDMLELGPTSPQLHASLLEPLERAGIDLIFLAGPMMAHLWERLPASRRGSYKATSAELAGDVEAALRSGDVLTVKGSLGSKMKLVIDRLAARQHQRPTTK